MGWRREEVWLQTEVLWFSEAPAVAVGGGFASVPAFRPALAPGLAASRRRRDEWRRRRYTRRARATVLALSPAVILPFAWLRTNAHGAKIVLEHVLEPHEGDELEQRARRV